MREATTAPVVGEMVRVLSLFDTEVTALLPMQVPDTEKHPPARSIPRANVEVAAVPVTLRYADWTPPVNVVVAGEPNVAAPVVPLKARAATVDVALYVEVAR